MTKELFRKYTEGRCNPQERTEIENWLHTCSENELDALMQQIWDDSEHEVMPADKATRMWKTLSGTILQPAAKVVGMYPRTKWSVAIAAAVIFIITMVWTSQKKQEMPALVQKPQLPSADTNIVDWAQVVNTSEKEKPVRLEDGSKITLFPASSITYSSKFGTGRRDIFLEGKAVFEVAKDSLHPFTVYSADIATTALGTKFMIDAGAHNSFIQVHLYEGKVVVKTGKHALNSWAKQEFLLPGDVLKYEIGRKTAAVKHNRPKQKQQDSKYSTARKTGGLAFKNEELPSVFEKIKQAYRINIIYSKADITGMYFTGSISQTSSLSGTLRIITQMNGLTLEEQNGKYIIRKTE
jgi:transmembrane sensor